MASGPTLGQAVIEIVADNSKFDQEVTDTGKTLSTKLTGTATKDLDKLDDALDDTKGKLTKLSDEAKTTGDSMNTGLADGADTAETKIMGVRDMIDGTAAIMQGPGEAGLSAYLQGWADLAGGIANTAAPVLDKVKGKLGDMVGAAASSTTGVAKAIGGQIVQWAKLGVQSLIHAAKVAAAWVISMGPILLVAAAVVGLVVLIIKNWDKIKEVIAKAWEVIKAGVQAAWDWIKKAFTTALDAIVNFFMKWTLLGLIIENWDKIKDAFKAAFDWITDKATDLIDWFKELPGKIGSAVSGMWNALSEGFRTALNTIIRAWNALDLELGPFRIPDWVPGLGGKQWHIPDVIPDIPTLHMGGIFRAPAGTNEGLALLRHGEAVIPASVVRRGGLGGVNVNIYITGSISDAQARHTGQVAAEAAIDRLSREAVLQ